MYDSVWLTDCYNTVADTCTDLRRGSSRATYIWSGTFPMITWLYLSNESLISIICENKASKFYKNRKSYNRRLNGWSLYYPTGSLYSQVKRKHTRFPVHCKKNRYGKTLLFLRKLEAPIYFTNNGSLNFYKTYAVIWSWNEHVTDIFQYTLLIAYFKLVTLCMIMTSDRYTVFSHIFDVMKYLITWFACFISPSTSKH